MTSSLITWRVPDLVDLGTRKSKILSDSTSDELSFRLQLLTAAKLSPTSESLSFESDRSRCS